MTEFPPSMPSKLAARYLGVCDASLRAWRADGSGPRFYRAGKKLVRYRRTDLDRWIEARLDAPLQGKGRAEEDRVQAVDSCKVAPS